MDPWFFISIDEFIAVVNHKMKYFSVFRQMSLQFSQKCEK